MAKTQIEVITSGWTSAAVEFSRERRFDRRRSYLRVHSRIPAVFMFRLL